MSIEHFLTNRGRGAAARRMLLVALVAAITGSAGIFTLPPLDRDESRFAQASTQMLESGDFVVIRFQNDERNKKPAGAYWLQAASVATFSKVEAREIWAYRLPSVLGAVLAAVFTYLAIARLFDPMTGLTAALLLATAPVVIAEATIAKTDALLLACVTGAAAALAHLLAAARDGKEADLSVACAFWVAVGAGVLIKGPIIFLVLAPAILLIAARFPETRPHRTLKPILGALILILIIGPWAAAIGMATNGRFFEEAVGIDMIAKIGNAQESHAGPPGYHLLLLPVLAWPLAALAPAGLYSAFLNRRAFSFWFLISWLAPAWLMFEFAATKLPHYVLPLYPALAGIAAVAARYPDRVPPRFWRIGAVIYAVAGIVLAVAVALLSYAYASGAVALGAMIGAAILVALTIWGTGLFWRGVARRGVIVSTAASAFLAFAILTFLLPRISDFAISPRLSAALDEGGLHPLRDGAPSAALAGFSEPSAVFLLGTKTQLGDGAAAADALINRGAAAIVERRERAAFEARLIERGVAAGPFAEIAGFNYSKGERVQLTVFRKLEGAPTP